jgi:hypothetical protein
MNVKNIGGYALIGVGGGVLFLSVREFWNLSIQDPKAQAQAGVNIKLGMAISSAILVGGVLLLRSK